ncbi:MAG: hypothetical protein HFH47_01900, partial [Bacilli bacterium]|nr:hypothetical protein [Bacilli bacterium]
ENDELKAGTNKELKVKVTFKDVNINKMEPSTSKLTVTLDFSQVDGSDVVEPEPEEPTPISETVYRWDSKSLNIGDSIEGIDTGTTSPTNRKYYLKHDVENNIIKASYVCFVTDAEHCIQGGSKDYYETNKELLQNQQTWFTSGGGSCKISGTSTTSYFNCKGGGFSNVNAFTDGSVIVSIPLDTNDSFDSCSVNSDGRSSCLEVRPA